MSERQNGAFVYAGFWWRFLACFVDSLILGAAGGVVHVTTNVSTPRRVMAAPLDQLMTATQPGPSNWVIIPVFFVFAAILALILLLLLVTVLYFVLFECSRFRATPGKMLCGLIVVDLHGNRISFWRAVARNLAKLLSVMTLDIGFMMAGWTERKQALHDMLAGCLVLKKVEAAATVEVPG